MRSWSGDTESLARAIRADILRMVHRAQASHVGSCLSCADILAVLYGRVLNVTPAQPDMPDRDRFVLSKGHAAAALYAALANCGFIAPSELDGFSQNGSPLTGHISHAVAGIEFSTGSLGHGLSIGIGSAIAAKMDGIGSRVFVLLSDGECDEGSVWEAALYAGYHGIDNLVAVIDYNKIQSFGRVPQVLDLEPLADKWRSFRWAVSTIDGHSHGALIHAFENLPVERGKPSLTLCSTVKGKGVPFMEDRLEWHYRSPDDRQLADALAALSPA